MKKEIFDILVVLITIGLIISGVVYVDRYTDNMEITTDTYEYISHNKKIYSDDMNLKEAIDNAFSDGKIIMIEYYDIVASIKKAKKDKVKNDLKGEL